MEDLIESIINDKYYELNLDKIDEGRFSKIRLFEGNAVGQIGENFIKSVMADYGTVMNDGITHDEYDVLMDNGIKFEVKTARKGSNNSFQFNGINPNYNYDFLICIGICPERVVYRIFKKEEIVYVHNRGDRGYRMIQGSDFNKKLSPMNPNNQVNHKLTLSLNQMFNINELPNVISNIMK